MIRTSKVPIAALLMGGIAASASGQAPPSASTAPPLTVIRTWSPVLTTIRPDSGYVLLAIELRPTTAEELHLVATELVVTDASGRRFAPVGSSAFSSARFEPFAGVSGYSTVSSDGSSIRMGRPSTADPFSFTLQGAGAKLFLVYIVTDSQRSFTLRLRGQPIPLVFKG